MLGGGDISVPTGQLTNTWKPLLALCQQMHMIGLFMSPNLWILTAKPKYPSCYLRRWVSHYTPSHLTIFVLKFLSLSKGETQVETLCNMVFSQMLFRECCLNVFSDQVNKDFIQYGFAHFARGTTILNKPLTILTAIEWLLQDPKFFLFHHLHQDFWKHSPGQNGFKVFLTFYLWHVFKTVPTLNKVFTFQDDHAKHSDLAWQCKKIEFMTVVSPMNKIKVSPLTVEMAIMNRH